MTPTQPRLRGLTVRQPWAWAIGHAGKNIENRTTLWRYRGPLAIHAGTLWSPPRASTETLQSAWAATGPDGGQLGPAADRLVYGAITAVTELVDAHPQSAACDPAVCLPWGEASHGAASGLRHVRVVHLVLQGTRLVTPVPCKGSRGLWPVPDEIAALLEPT